MIPVLIFIVAQLMYGIIAIGVVSHPTMLQAAKKEAKNVLGVSRLADNSESPYAVPDVPTVAPEHSQQLVPSEPTSSPQTESSSGFNEPIPTNEVTSVPSPTTAPENKETNSVSLSPTPVTLESSASETETVLNPESVTNIGEHVDKESVDEVQKEEDSIATTKSPEEKGKLLITFANDKVQDMEKNIKEDDFATTTFAAARLTDTIDRATDQIQRAPAALREQLTEQVSTFCRDADAKLKNQELSVPEESEQDIEITRAKCFEYR